ncbi:DUF6924 domain-containing protein [Kineococcus sp. NBC_00420]|uniref:DUF6924 domain-containing protein n=1 Tax=Kineococcus sp. NBC_00420 TaxID=2903564 RepID=UPI003FA5D75F
MRVTADAETLSAPEPPLLVLHVIDDVAVEVRVVANRAVATETNLTLGNRDGEEYLDEVDRTGSTSVDSVRDSSRSPRVVRGPELAATSRSYRCPDASPARRSPAHRR